MELVLDFKVCNNWFDHFLIFCGHITRSVLESYSKTTFVIHQNLFVCLSKPQELLKVKF